MPELLDYVNNNNEVIGQATLKDIIANGWQCRIIQVFVINNNGEILTQWRGAHKRGPHLYDSSVGGHVDAGESYNIAATREMQEELGLNQPLEFISKIYDDEVNKFGQLYITKSNGPFTNWQAEADTLEWFTIAELEQLINRLPYMFTGGLKSSLQAYKKYIQNN